MANITVRNDGGKTPAVAPGTAWEPGRLLRSLMQWDPFLEMAPMAIQDRPDFFPTFDVKETKTQYVFVADMPGLKASDLDVSLSGNRLTIGGKRESEREDKGGDLLHVRKDLRFLPAPVHAPRGGERKRSERRAQGWRAHGDDRQVA